MEFAWLCLGEMEINELKKKRFNIILLFSKLRVLITSVMKTRPVYPSVQVTMSVVAKETDPEISVFKVK